MRERKSPKERESVTDYFLFLFLAGKIVLGKERYEVNILGSPKENKRKELDSKKRRRKEWEVAIVRWQRQR